MGSIPPGAGRWVEIQSCTGEMATSGASRSQECCIMHRRTVSYQTAEVTGCRRRRRTSSWVRPLELRSQHNIPTVTVPSRSLGRTTRQRRKPSVQCRPQWRGAKASPPGVRSSWRKNLKCIRPIDRPTSALIIAVICRRAACCDLDPCPADYSLWREQWPLGDGQQGTGRPCQGKHSQLVC